MNEPIADAARGILDGHIILSRKIAAKNLYPAIDILSSISRLMSEIADEKLKTKSGELRDVLATYKEAEDLINIGAYQKGSNPKIDRSINLIDQVNDFLKQKMNEHSSFNDTYEQITSIS
jgi:flagellum-specific ATP synthase